MIIVEGPDGSGKSTLVEHLHRDTGLTVKTWPGSRDSLYLDARRRTYQSMMGAMGVTAPVIHNRLFFSELVYGSVLRGSIAFSENETRFIRRFLAAVPVPVFVCMPPTPVIEQNVEESAQMSGVGEHIRELIDAYKTVLSQPSGNVYWYDYTGKNEDSKVRRYAFGADHATEIVDEYLRSRRERSWSLSHATR